MKLEDLKSAVPLEGDKLRDVMRQRADLGGPATFDADNECVRSAATSSRAMAVETERLRQLVAQRGMEWDDAYADRARVYWASDERVNSYGDIDRQDWDFSAFETNSPFLAQHGWSGRPIGRCVDWSVVQRSEADYNGPALSLTCLFGVDEMASEYFDLVSRGFLPAGSVTFKSRRIIHVEDDQERAALGLGRYGVILEDNLLLEFSAVTIPANAGAMVRSLQGRSDELTMDNVTAIREAVRRHICRTSRSMADFLDFEAGLLRLARVIDPKANLRAHRELDAPLGLADVESEPRSQAVRVDADDLIERMDQCIAALQEGNAARSREAAAAQKRNDADELMSRMDRARANFNSN